MKILCSRTASTLIEFVVSFSIMSIIAYIAVGGFSEIRESVRKKGGLTSFISYFNAARSQAVAGGNRVIIGTTVDGTIISVGADYIPFSDDYTEDKILFFRELPLGVSLTLSSPLAINPFGFAIDNKGAPANVSFSLSYLGEIYCKGEILSSGQMDYVC
ncbi:MAG: hypothetical protein D6808_04165 [Candidatus Dadabacteria bacterium]|nr:MAG: hypothetical protein D6808_04165 [Candidatus Dadabacteria bacterium]